ncbi:MAG: hypothetical protein EOQ57_27030 [Mesorhizobium sp.]|uniref:hypothetical protein n=1 Tax=Mesorhizobium sp. TaxID=1871066 RepID=UPI000FE70BC2|nr:hypothetical protein [Mesorhizobium sp.]RWB96366.1 MAG: hypothetical protein EOQ57_27030 [Mesorhizobium sp.]
MTPTELTRLPPASSSDEIRSGIGAYLGGRGGLIAAGVVIVVAGLAVNWSWLVAAGVAPVLLSLLPCAAMCALGVCMHGMTGRSSSTESVSHKESADITKLHSGDVEGRG